jgi:hypothetical protein
MRHLINCPELSQASQHHLLEFGFFLDMVKPWFLTEGKFATVLIIPSSWGSQLGGYPTRNKHIPLKDIAVILGMDWLEENGAQIDCKEKTVSLRNPGGGRIVYQDDKHAHIEVQLQLNTLKEAKLEDIPVVNEFQDVFPRELRGMSPDRDIEFTIDLIPGTAPIAQAPYKMGPKELVELKEQKGFIQESISHWGTPVIFVDKRDRGRR